MPKKKKVIPAAEGSPKKKGPKKAAGKTVPATTKAAPKKEASATKAAPKTPLDRARAIWHKAPSPERVVVVYAAYKTAFECREGVVRWKDIDDEYCLSFVFKGNFARQIRAFPKGANSNDPDAATVVAVAVGDVGLDDEGNRDAARDEIYFLGMDPAFDGKYVLEVEESEEGLNVQTRDGPLVFERDPNDPAFPIGDAANRAEGCSCIYGNPCADQYVCLNWANRFEIATKNGWKGF